MWLKEDEMVARHGKSLKDINIDINFQNQKLKDVDSCEYLGVYVDNNLSDKSSYYILNKFPSF